MKLAEIYVVKVSWSLVESLSCFECTDVWIVKENYKT